MFSGVEETIVITQFFFQFSHFIARITGNDTVHQRRTEAVSLIQPLNKCFWQCPLLRIAQHQFTQRVAIVVDQLTRDDDPTFIQRTVEMAKAFEQQTGQFCRIAYRWRVIEFIARMVADPRFGGVRENKAHFRVVRQFQEFIVFTVDADFTINRANQTRVADRFPLLIQATDNGGIQTILRAQ
ncbi:Uncharacterised protein [Shigella sonnei]|nr:Uncharacterised protein [Shigella sonnei]CSP70324.1 Uncharacterised protein [Shigella sonnei]CSP99792.1 Uncharacterised protein [Shigella sonnei]CSS48763.1 Uncharacterised protein [Shigella sonnei]CSZ38811.1 Uncharacterised protein [Shigella sonnei]